MRIDRPTITDYTDAVHNHSSVEQGGFITGLPTGNIIAVDNTTSGQLFPLMVGANVGNIQTANVSLSKLYFNAQSGNLYVGGNVGILTTSPSVALEVGSTTSGQNAKIVSTLGSEMAPPLEAANWTLGTGWTASGGVLSHTAGISTATPSGTFVVTPGKTYKVVMTVTGYTGSAGYLYYEIGGSRGTNLAIGTIVDYITARTSAKIIFTDVSVNETVTITSLSVKELNINTGNLDVDGTLTVNSLTSFMNPVGFNTKNPTVPLEVMEKSQEGIRVTRNGTPGQYIAINEADGAAHTIRGVGEKLFRLINQATTFGVEFYVNTTTQALTILSTGNVGIGTASPTSPLHVIGNANVTSTLSAGTLISTGNISATGNVTAGNASITSTLSAGNISTTGNANVSTLIVGNIVANSSYGSTGQFLAKTGTGVTWSSSTVLQLDINRYGFLNQTETTHSFNDVSYTYTLGDAGAGWSYYRAGIKYTISGNKTVTLPGSPPAKGSYFIFFDSTDGTLTQSLTPWTLDDTKVLVSLIIWDNAATPKYWILEERHTCLIDRRLHRYLHNSRGTQWISGGVPSGQVVATDIDTDKTFAISQAVIADEDIFQTLTALSDPNGITADYVVMYRTASTVWTWESSTMPFRYTPAGYIQYDNSATMTQASGVGTKYLNSYLIYTNVTNGAAGRFMILSGRQEFASLAAAQAEDPRLLDWTGIPMTEWVWGYQFTWEVRSVYTSTGKCELAAAPVRIFGNLLGAVSATGASGISGYSGVSGYSGYSGISGYSGYSGISGYSGYSGRSGYSGTSGYSGYSGISGYSGVSGYSGYSGVSGYSGYSGVSGYSGAAGPSNTINATNNTTMATLYPVMVGAAGSNQTANVTTSGFTFNAVTGNLYVSGNVGVGTAPGAYRLEVAGSFAATTKSFLIEHPTKPGMRLQYGSLEGPENGVYLRGVSSENIIVLPEYWIKLVDAKSITVYLTPIGLDQNLFVEKIENNTVYVNGKGKLHFYYLIQAERIDVERLSVEIK